MVWTTYPAASAEKLAYWQRLASFFLFVGALRLFKAGCWKPRVSTACRW